MRSFQKFRSRVVSRETFISIILYSFIPLRDNDTKKPLSWAISSVVFIAFLFLETILWNFNQLYYNWTKSVAGGSIFSGEWRSLRTVYSGYRHYSYGLTSTILCKTGNPKFTHVIRPISFSRHSDFLEIFYVWTVLHTIETQELSKVFLVPQCRWPTLKIKLLKTEVVNVKFYTFNSFKWFCG